MARHPNKPWYNVQINNAVCSLICSQQGRESMHIPSVSTNLWMDASDFFVRTLGLMRSCFFFLMLNASFFSLNYVYCICASVHHSFLSSNKTNVKKITLRLCCSSSFCQGTTFILVKQSKMEECLKFVLRLEYHSIISLGTINPK